LLSCNVDATAGLFRQISESKAPVGIVYKQIVGQYDDADPLTTNPLYFLTDEGLFSTNGMSSTKLVANEEGNIIQTAYVDSTAAKVVFQTNDGTKKLYSYDIASETVDSAAIADFSTYDVVKLLPNGLVLTKDATSTYKLFDYDVPASEIATTGAVNGYDLVSVLQLSGKEHEAPSDTTPMLVSLVNESGNYKHFYIDGTGAATALDSATTDSLRFTSLAVDGSNIYVLAIESDENIGLYKATSSIASFTNVYDTSKSFPMHTFMYAKKVGTDLKLIAKPSGINDALYVLSISSTGAVSASDKTDGYGEYLNAAEIVDSYEKNDGTLLVATLENGMYSIDVLGDDSSDSEEYTL
jgi:hypothetical protein